MKIVRSTEKRSEPDPRRRYQATGEPIIQYSIQSVRDSGTRWRMKENQGIRRSKGSKGSEPWDAARVIDFRRESAIDSKESHQV